MMDTGTLTEITQLLAVPAVLLTAVAGLIKAIDHYRRWRGDRGAT